VRKICVFYRFFSRFCESQGADASTHDRLFTYSEQNRPDKSQRVNVPYRRFQFTFQDTVAKFVPKFPIFTFRSSEVGRELRSELPNFETNFRTSKRTSEFQSTHGVTYVMACEELTDFLGNIEQKIGKESYEIITNT
jgi:hypothetical protein